MQKIAELNSRFCEQQQRPLKGLGTLLASLTGTVVHRGWPVGQISYPRHGGHARLGTLGHSGEQVGHEVGAAALPAGSSKDRGDGVLQPLVSIGGYQLHPAEASSGQRPQEG